MIPKFLELGYLSFVVAGIPLLSWRTMRNRAVRSAPRTALYASAVISQWIAAGLGIAVVFTAGISFSRLYFHSPRAQDFALWALAVAAASLAIEGFFLWAERRGWWPQESDLMLLLLPGTRREMGWALLVLSPTAAICEEFIYRGFAISELHAFLGSTVAAVAIATVAFGLAHCYQGWAGMFRAAVLGLLLAWPVIHLGSLYPAMAAHWIIDAAGFAWLGPGHSRTRTRIPEV